MKNWINKIPKEKMQKYIFLGMLVLVFVAFFISLSLIEQEKPNQGGNNDPIDDDGSKDDDDKTDDDVVAELFKMPIASEEYKVVRKFYSVNASDEERELAVINYGSSYYMSQGMSIRSNDDKSFDVVCSIGGVVKNVTESALHGIIVTIEHEESVYTEYSSLASTTLKAGDTIKQGDAIGVAGECEYDQGALIHVHFKVIKNDKTYDPEKLIGKSLKDVK